MANQKIPSMEQMSKKEIVPFKSASTISDQTEKPDSYATVLECMKKNNFFKKTRHIKERQSERSISIYEIKHVLINGYCYDTCWHAKRGAWHYSINGVTLAGRNISVVVCLNQSRSKLKLLTAIDRRFTSQCPPLSKSIETRAPKKPEERLSKPRCFSLSSFVKEAPPQKRRASI